MPVVVVWRWALLGLLRSPWVDLFAAGLVLLVPLVQGLRSFPSARGALEVGLEGAAAAGILGSAHAVALLSSHSPLLVRLAPGQRWSAESGALLLAALILQLPVFLGALAAGARVVDLLHWLPDILTSAGILAGTAQLLLIPTLATAHRVLLFFAAVWFLPALVSSGASVAGDLLRSFEAAALLRVRTGSGLSPHAAAAVVLALLGYLLRTRPGRLRPR